MEKRTYLIPKQIKDFSSRDKEILKLLGIELEYIPAIIQNDTLLCAIDFSVRAMNIIKSSLGRDWKNLTISDLIGRRTEKDLLKCRNCGIKTIKEINKALYPYGFKLSTH